MPKRPLDQARHDQHKVPVRLGRLTDRVFYARANRFFSRILGFCDCLCAATAGR